MAEQQHYQRFVVMHWCLRFLRATACSASRVLSIV